MGSLLQTLYGYHAWANVGLLDTLDSVDRGKRGSEFQAALRLVNHCHVVSRIFASHLQGVPHDFTSDDPEEIPALDGLRAAVMSCDQWYRDYVRGASSATLCETVAFTFTDGDKGCMSREEMLTHVVLHAGYHRGEVGRLLRQIAVTPPWETYAVHLHQSAPSRRQQAGSHRPAT